MNLANRWAELIYRLATAKSRLKIILTPIGGNPLVKSAGSPGFGFNMA